MERPGRIQQLMAAALMAITLWLMIPEHKRHLIAMRLTVAAQRLTGHLARAEGQAGMGSELDGRPDDAERRYSAAYSLSRARDAFGRALDGMRP